MGLRKAARQAAEFSGRFSAMMSKRGEVRRRNEANQEASLDRVTSKEETRGVMSVAPRFRTLRFDDQTKPSGCFRQEIPPFLGFSSK